MKKYGKFLIIIAAVLITMLLLESDDKELFMGMGIDPGLVKPNVVVLMDTSGSMNHVIWYPKYGLDGIENNEDDGYDPTVDYTGTLEGMGSEWDANWETNTTRWHARWLYNGNSERYNRSELVGIGPNNESYVTGCYADDGTANPVKFKAGSNGRKYFNVGDRILYRGPNNDALATIVAKEDETGTENSWITLGDIVGGPILSEANAWSYEDRYQFQKAIDANHTPVIARLYGTVDEGQNTRYLRNYLKWLYIHASDAHREAVSYFSTYGTFDVTVDPADIPTSSNCSTDGTTFERKVFTRIQVAREVACKVGEDAAQIVRLGLFRFDGSYGGYIMDVLHDMSEEASLVDYKKTIYTKMPAEGWTPLAEALADIWYYYRPGPESKPYWPVNLDSNVSATYEVEHWCQNNYVVIVTDGQSTYDQLTGDGHFSGSIFTTYPVKRSQPWTKWSDGWGDTDNNDIKEHGYIPASYDPASSIYCPNWTCWQRIMPDGSNWHGSDLLDDVAYFMANSDLFPEKKVSLATGEEIGDLYTEWPGKQCVYTYSVGFTIDNDMLRATAVNGDGAYYTASNYEELVEAFQSIFTSILLRNFAFSAITAPKKTATTTNQDLSISYVGYFMPSQAASLWEGHLLAYQLLDRWGFDVDNNGEVDATEFVYETEDSCHDNSGGKTCVRFVDLALEHDWDAAERLPADRNLYTHHPDTTTLIDFEDASVGILQPLFGATTTGAETQLILDKIDAQQLGDIFHADVGFVGPPRLGKKFIGHADSLDPSAERFETFYENHKDRRRVLFTGSNDGILHMFYADDPVHADTRDAGKEIWGFIPDVVLPTLKTIVIDGEHNYTVDGRLSAQDIYFKKPGDGFATWSTVLGFGLRDGGSAYYQLDISDVTDHPGLMWKFADAEHSGNSWGKPNYGRIRVQDPTDPDLVIDKWVVMLAGGFAFNYENPNDVKGKAIFMVDAANGELIRMIGFHSGGAEDSDSTDWLDTSESADGKRFLSSEDIFNFPIPALNAVDKDGDGFLDYVYFGNTGGHLFKADISSENPDNWHVYLLYQTNIETTAITDITAISADGKEITVRAKVFEVGQTIVGQTSHAMGHITAIDNKILFVKTLGGTFMNGENVLKRSYDPIFISPSVTLDRCNNLWLAFGSGDRDRPRTNKENGGFFVLKDNDTYGRLKGNLTAMSWTAGTMDPLPEGTTISDGFYFEYPGDGEKFFDPEPIILPDKDLVPHIFFNTYTPAVERVLNQEDPCDVPSEGTMTLYQIALLNCGDNPAGEKQGGRIAGGGIYQGKEYIMYVGVGEVASVPPMEQTEARRLPYPGGIIFWKERKR